jgi:diguanylate cyclase (GGDEF)-like protein
MWTFLRRDPVIRLSALVLAGLTPPFLLPGLGPTERAFASVFLLNVPPLLLTILATAFGRGRLTEPVERRFWALWTAGFSLYLAQEVLACVSLFRPSSLSSLLQDALHVGFYLLLVLGLQLEPHLGGSLPAPNRLRQLRATGNVVFALGLLTYLSAVPLLYDRPLFATDIPSLILWLVLGADLLLRLLGALRSAGGPRWRTLYSWLVATAALWIITDAAEAMFYVGLVDLPDGAPTDLLWLLPFVTLIVGVRLREFPFRPTLAISAPSAAPSTPAGPAPASGGELGELWGESLVAYAAAFPLMHFALYSSGALDPTSRPARETLALVLLTVLAGLAIVYQKLLLAEHRRFEEVRLRAAQAEHRAFHDALTGLPNRYLLLDRLQLALPRARRSRSSVGVFFLDLDRFKVVNDTLGHSAGDQILKEVADRLSTHVRQVDTLARIGGDEFTVLVEGIHHPEDAAKVAHKLLESVRAPLPFGGREIFLTASVGLSLYPDDADTADALLAHSDIAMYRAKAPGGDGFRLFRADMNLWAEERLGLESALRKALGLGQFALQYQPFVEIASGRVTGCEALVRWQHPDLGLLLPGAFIELAEMTGVITSLGPWIIRSACREALRWQRPGEASIPVAVNVSPRQFQQPELLGEIGGILRDEGLPAHCLELEITETIAMQDPERTAETLRALKGLGVRISIDDFGTGYSSLAYLKRFPIDTLKIDRSFVSGIDVSAADATIAATVIAMARRLELGVVAEGVERPEQLEWLRREGCGRAQGHLLSPPLWPVDLLARLGRGPGPPEQASAPGQKPPPSTL